GEAEFLEGQGIQGSRPEGAPRAVPKDPSGGIPGEGAGVDAHLQGALPGLGQNGDALPGFLVPGVKVEVEYGSVRGRIEKVEFLERVSALVSVLGLGLVDLVTAVIGVGQNRVLEPEHAAAYDEARNEDGRKDARHRNSRGAQGDDFEMAGHIAHREYRGQENGYGQDQ